MGRRPSRLLRGCSAAVGSWTEVRGRPWSPLLEVDALGTQDEGQTHAHAKLYAHTPNQPNRKECKQQKTNYGGVIQQKEVGSRK